MSKRSEEECTNELIATMQSMIGSEAADIHAASGTILNNAMEVSCKFMDIFSNNSIATRLQQKILVEINARKSYDASNIPEESRNSAPSSNSASIQVAQHLNVCNDGDADEDAPGLQ